MTLISDGIDFNFFDKITVSSASFGGTADVEFNFSAVEGFSLVNEGTTLVEYSFNGTDLHGDMTPDTLSAGIYFEKRKVSQIWFRAPDGGSPVVRVEAWTHVKS